jgi:hypothetical protein
MSKSSGYLVILGLVTAAPLAAQDIAQLARRLDSVNHASIAVRDSLVAYRQAHPASYGEYTDSVVIGAGRVKILFNDELAAAARAGAAETEKHLADFGAAVNRAGPFVFSVVPDTATSPYEQRYGGAISVRQHYAIDPANPNRTSTSNDARSIAFVITSAVSMALTSTAGSKITEWTHGAFALTPRLIPRIDWDGLRLSLVSSSSYLGKSCYLGDLRACARFLGLDSVADPARMLWDSTGRRLAVKYETEHFSRASRVATERCLAGNDDACITVLTIGFPAPLAGPYERGSVIIEALELGGAGAAERLLTARGSAGEALAATANQPTDSVVAIWQRHLNNRTGSSALPLVAVISSIAWIAVCVFLALRSSRWR